MMKALETVSIYSGYKKVSAQAHNLPVMLEALANKADPNWISMENEDKTPIIIAIETVSIYSGYKKISAQAHNLPAMLEALANKADPNRISM